MEPSEAVSAAIAVEAAEAEHRRRWVPFLVTVVLTVLLASGFTVVYVGRTVQQMCGLIKLLADDQPPPQTERGRAQVVEAQKLGRQFHC